MKKPLFIIIYMLLLGIPVFAQRHYQGTNDTSHIYGYVLLSGGISQPGGDYGSASYDVNETPFEYGGYANKGNYLSINGGLVFQKGWELVGAVSYYRHPFDATGFLQETSDCFFDYTGATEVSYLGSSAPGTYYYNSYSAVFGLAKNWTLSSRFLFGLSLYAGVIKVNRPSIDEISTLVFKGNNDTGTYRYDISSFTETNPMVGTQFHFDFYIIPHLFVRAILDFELSSIDINGNIQVYDMNGNEVYSNILTNAEYPPRISLSMRNISLGIGYLIGKK